MSGIPVDNAAYADFAAAMTTGGSNYGWQAYQVTNLSGDNLAMYRLTTDAIGTALTDTMGPILLQHGMFSDVYDWLERTDTITDALPIKLANAGYDVWLSVGRGRDGSDTHTTLDLADPISKALYWDFSFEDQGLDDLEAQIDEIIAQRGGLFCSKVQVLAHGSAANAALVGLSENPMLGPKVQQLVALGPCLNMNFTNFWSGAAAQDPASVQMLYFLMSGFDNMFGPDFATELTTKCVGIESLCAGLFSGVDSWPYYQLNSRKDYNHVS